MLLTFCLNKIKTFLNWNLWSRLSRKE